MSDDDDNQPTVPATTVLRSPVFVGLAISAASQLAIAFPKLFVAIGWTDPQKINAGVEALCAFAALAATLYAMYKRKTSKVAPLTFTKKAAAAKNAPVSVPPTTGDMQ